MKKSNLLLLLLAFCINASFAQSVGTTEGVFNVSEMGAANYSIPIKVSDGINGMQPTLAISYSSQGSNGPLGMGWSISGLSAITRTGNTIYHDSKVNGISLSSNDKFALDGNRLIVTGGTYGASASKYRTEVETFKDITANGVLGSGPQSFTVTDQNGWTYEYGNTSDSRQVPVGKTEAITWYLNKVTDRNGNYMLYEYNNIDGNVLPKYVKYNCNQNTGLNYLSYVYFSYATSTDPNTSYIAGGIIKSTKRINKISSVQKVGTAWHYYRSYIPEYVDASSYSHLKKITEKGENETEALAPTEFTYGETTSINNEIDASGIDNGSNAFIPLDYNGDGLSDVVRIPTNAGAYSNSGSRQWSLFKNTGNNTFTFIQSGSLPNLNNNNDNVLDPSEFSDIVHGWKDISMFDYNGDGYDDMIIKNKFNNSTNTLFAIYLSDGSTGFNLLPNVRKSDGTQFGINNTITGDFDGDGRSEVIAVGNATGDKSYIIGQKYLTSKPFGSTPYEFIAPFVSSSSKLYVIDYNGDGKSDIMWANGGSTYVYEMNVTFDANSNPVLGSPLFSLVNTNGYPTSSHNVNTGDFNGDGITDVLTNYDNSNQTTVWEIGYGNGKGSFIASPNQPFTGKKQVIVGDFNGDSKSDIFTTASSARQMYYSKGNDAFKFESLSIGEIDNSIFLFGQSFRYCSSDFNGDGSVDILGEIKSSGILKILTFHPNETLHLLSKVKNGLGAETKINYLPLTNSSVYTSGSVTYTYPFVKRTIPFKAVSSVVNDNGINLTGNTTSYNYTGLKFHAYGKGLMGFDKVVSFELSSLVKIEKNFILNTIYAFPYLQNSVTIDNNTTVNVTSTSYDIYHYGSKRIFPYQTTAEQYNALTGESIQTTNNYVFPSGGFNPIGVTYSQHIGKPFSITTNKGNGLEVTTQTFAYPNYSNTSPGNLNQTSTPVWVYSKPSKIVTTNTRQGQSSYSRTATYVYNSISGLLSQTINDPNTINSVTGSFTYDSYGNPVKKTVFSPGLPNNETNMTYDASHRFVSETFNTSYTNIKNTATFDALTGNKLTETAPDGFTTTYTYDGFGRLKTTSDNNGLTTTTSYGWGYVPPGVTTPTVAGAIYYKKVSANSGAVSATKFDRMGRELSNTVNNFQNNWVHTKKWFNDLGQLAGSTKPYFSNETPKSITSTYDAYGRPTQISAPEGNTTYAYLYQNTYPQGTGSYTVTQTNPSGQQTKMITDKSGKKIQTKDADNNNLIYNYHSNGNVKEVISGSTQLQTYTYDAYNNLTERWDPNYGIYKYAYNAYGQTLSKTDPKSQTYTFKYDGLGRMYQKTGPEGNYDYTFENNIGTNCGKMITLSGPEGKITYYNGMSNQIYKVTYDDNGMAANSTGNSSYGNYSCSYAYYSNGLLGGKYYSTGIGLSYAYGSNGELITINDANTGTTFYQKQSENAAGQTTAYSQNSGYNINNIITTENTYDTHNLLTGQKTSLPNANVLRNMAYNFDATTGNLLNRKDNKYGLAEIFSYDNLNRLTDITNSNNSTLNIGMQYSASGNIEEKTDVGGSFEYDQANRVSTINLNNVQPQNIPHVTQELSYTSFDKVSTIEEGDYHTYFHYWPDGSRSMMVTTNNITGAKMYKIYVFDMEMKYNLSTAQDRLTAYIDGPEGNIIGMQTIENGGIANHFVLADHLGSFTQIIDDWGNIEEEKSFDAWGRLRNPQTWEPYASNIDAGQPQQLFDRGYTGHEHLPYYGIVNMNGRLYDPVMGRMFSPDVNIIGTDDLQGYNRYSYALNNPLKFNDPTGNTPDYYAPLWQAYTNAYNLFMYSGGMTYVDMYAVAWLHRTNELNESGTVAGFTLSGGVDGFVTTGLDLNNAFGNSWNADKRGGTGGSNMAAGKNGITVISYYDFSDPGQYGTIIRGVNIDLGYNNLNMDYTDFRWVQTVRTNDPMGGSSTTYTDPRPNDDNMPFYYTNAEQPDKTNVYGYNVIFHDMPARGASNLYWHGELSLVGQKSGRYSIITTLEYGFSVTNGKFQSEPLVFSQPSFFTLMTLWNYNYYNQLLNKFSLKQ
jgi:RHS repeat-associated protein